MNRQLLLDSTQQNVNKFL